ncbi:MAG: hypothetical protein MJ252_24435, partial [archaeon]|nr:hypothetical protein [archaeon]
SFFDCTMIYGEIIKNFKNAEYNMTAVFPKRFQIKDQDIKEKYTSRQKDENNIENIKNIDNIENMDIEVNNNFNEDNNSSGKDQSEDHLSANFSQFN